VGSDLRRLTAVVDSLERREAAFAAAIAILAVFTTAWFTRSRDWSDFWNLRRSLDRGRRKLP
jgi:hypothetical protein